MVAKSIVDVILGEAGGKTDYERFEDMVAIASVIQNRANKTNETPDSIISAKGQFDAYGRALPPGVEAKRGLAEAAWATVQRAGPVHGATFYATPSAAGNLPRGLKGELSTSAHVYRSDPQNRAIATASGFKAPVAVELPQVAPIPQQIPDLPLTPIQNPYEDAVPSRVVPSTTTRSITPGAGLANLTPNGLAGIDYNMGPNRPNPPGAEIQGIVQSAVTDMLGPDYTVNITSGRGEYGSNRHRGDVGRAMDFNIKGPAGERITDKQALTDVAHAALAKGAKGWGYGPEYMGPATMHLDTVMPGKGQAHTWGSVGRANRDSAIEAMNFALMPASFYDRALPSTMPAPQSRDAALTAPAVPNFAGGQSPRSAQEVAPPTVPGGPFANFSGGLSPRGAEPSSLAYAPPATPAPQSVPAPAIPSVPAPQISLPANQPALSAAPGSMGDIDLPGMAQIPTAAPRNAARDFAGGILGPASKQIGRNMMSNFRGQPINPFAGIPAAYRASFRDLGDRIANVFGGRNSMPAPAQFNVGTGLGAIQSVARGGMAPGATAYSASHPGASWSVNAYGQPEFTSAHGFSGVAPEGFFTG